ncbi:MAG: DnaB-like helicase C-terminal domain-containing protein [Acidimicrobiales bacterium]
MALLDDINEVERHFAVASLLRPATDGLTVVRDTARLPTGFDPLDRVLGGGFRRNDLILLGGRPGVGKTIAGLQWARAVAMSGATAFVASYEHDEQTLLGRLIALEIGMFDLGPVDMETEALVAGMLNGEFAANSDAGRHPLVRAAISRVEMYADRLVLLPAARLRMDLDRLESAYASVDAERKLLVIDYVQKVPIAGPVSSWDADGARIVAGRLKDLAMSTSSAVVAIAAVDDAGLQSRRVRVEHLRSAASLSYEADIAIMMNEKALCTSRVHTAYDLTRIEAFEKLVVFSIEKNRSGRSALDLEFTKDFERFRFVPTGHFVAETLIDGVAVDQ